MEHRIGAVLLLCWHFVPSTHTRNTRSAVLKIFTRLSGLCSQNGAQCESLACWVCCCALAARSHCYVLIFSWQLLQRVCGSAVLAACLSGWPSAAGAMGLFCPGEAGPDQLFSGSGWDV